MTNKFYVIKKGDFFLERDSISFSREIILAEFFPSREIADALLKRESLEYCTVAEVILITEVESQSGFYEHWNKVKDLGNMTPAKIASDAYHAGQEDERKRRLTTKKLPEPFMVITSSTGAFYALYSEGQMEAFRSNE